MPKQNIFCLYGDHCCLLLALIYFVHTNEGWLCEEWLFYEIFSRIIGIFKGEVFFSPCSRKFVHNKRKETTIYQEHVRLFVHLRYSHPNVELILSSCELSKII